MRVTGRGGSWPVTGSSQRPPPPDLPLPGGRDASTGMVGMIKREVILRGELFLSPPRWAPPRGVLASFLELVDGSYVVADVRSTSEHLYAIATLAAFWGTASLLLLCVCTAGHRCGSPPFGASGDGPCDGLRCAASTDALRQRGGCRVCSI